MKSSKYWRKREQEHIKKMIKDDERIARRIKRKYKETQSDINKEIEAFYGRYAGKEGITMEEARKRVRKTDIKNYEKKAKKYVKEKNFTPRANEEMRRYNVTMRVNRLELLKKDIQLELLAMTSEEERILFEAMTENTRKEYERLSGILGDTLHYNEKQIKSIVNASFLNATWSDRIWKNQEALRAEIDKLVNRGIIQGKNPRELARDLRKNIDSSVYNSERIMRTEMARARTDVFVDSAKQADIEKYEWIAEPTACHECAALDGKVFTLDELKIGDNGVPKHPNCMCAIAMYFDDEAYYEDLETRGL